MKHALKTLFVALVVAGLCAGPALALDSVTNGFWDVDATWGGSIPTGADNVVITNGCTVTIRTNTAISVQSLTIETNGVLTHSANSTTVLGERYKVVLDIANDLTIDLGGEINVGAKGYAGGQGTGVGSHGGIGAFYSSYSAGLPYGSLTAPTNIASGGFISGTSGGGAVILNVAGASSLSGTISANGGVSGGGWGAPGGSVTLRTGTITGSPTISANGSSAAGGNGGGRIALILTGAGADFAGFTGAVVSAYGGVYGTTGNGAAGTVYRETQAQAGGQGVVTIDNNNVECNIRVTTAIPSNQTWTVPSFELVRGGVIGVPANATFDITGKTVTVDSVNKNTGITLQGGTLVAPTAYAFTNYFVRYISASTFNPTSITVGTNAQFICNVPYTTSGNLTVQSGGIVTHDINTSTEANKLELTVNGDFTLESGGTVNVNAKGRSTPASASHGGVGGPWGASYPHGGLTYGSITAPTLLGRGSITQGGHGGGAAILNVLGASDIAGTISAKGGQQSGWSGPGGSVYIRTATLTGSGTISANGYNAAAAAGGGRIAIVLTGVGATFSSFSGATLQTYGGFSGTSRGGAGTIYMETQPQGANGGLLLINGDGTAPSAVSSTLICSNVTDTVVGSVIITNMAVLAISNQVLTVQGDWDNQATCRGLFDSTVILASTNFATINGNNEFYNLTAGAVGKTIQFEADKTNTVNGKLTFADDTTLLSTADGTQWWLDLSSATGSQEVGLVVVKDSNASPGQEILAGNGSTDLKNNENWSFPAKGSVFIVR